MTQQNIFDQEPYEPSQFAIYVKDRELRLGKEGLEMCRELTKEALRKAREYVENDK